MHVLKSKIHIYMLLINVQCISGISNGFDLMEYNRDGRYMKLAT